MFTLQTRLACDPEDQFGETVGKVAGFSLHAGVVNAKANERKKLERLCRYISRPGVSEKRLSLTPNGNVRYQLNTLAKRGKGNKAKALDEPQTQAEQRAAMTWAQRLKRVFTKSRRFRRH